MANINETISFPIDIQKVEENLYIFNFKIGVQSISGQAPSVQLCKNKAKFLLEALISEYETIIRKYENIKIHNRRN